MGTVTQEARRTRRISKSRTMHGVTCESENRKVLTCLMDGWDEFEKNVNVDVLVKIAKEIEAQSEFQASLAKRIALQHALDRKVAHAVYCTAMLRYLNAPWFIRLFWQKPRPWWFTHGSTS